MVFVVEGKLIGSFGLRLNWWFYLYQFVDLSNLGRLWENFSHFFFFFDKSFTFLWFSELVLCFYFYVTVYWLCDLRISSMFEITSWTVNSKKVFFLICYFPYAPLCFIHKLLDFNFWVWFLLTSGDVSINVFLWWLFCLEPKIYQCLLWFWNQRCLLTQFWCVPICI